MACPAARVSPWPTVYYWCRQWRLDGTCRRLHDALREQLRLAVGRRAQPSAGVVDPSQPLAAAHAMGDDDTAFNRATISYAMPPHTARVYFDMQAGEVAGRHLGGYAAAAQEVNQLVAEVVAWGFRQQGQRCLCLCPACALGARPCVASITTTTNRAWGTTAPSSQEPGVPVVRTASCPATLDLQDGDVLTTTDRQAVQTYGAVPDAIVRHAPGESVQIQVARGGVLIPLTATRR
jgi:transposase